MKSNTLISNQSIAGYTPGQEQFSENFMRHNQAILLDTKKKCITVGLIDIENTTIKNIIRGFFFSKPETQQSQIQFVSIAQAELQRFLAKHVSTLDVVKTTNEKKHLPENPDLLDKLAHEAPIINLVNSIILEGIQQNASDIHIESLPSKVLIRMRIHGVLIPERSLSPDVMTGISSRIKVMGKLNILERRHPQDGRMRVTVENNSVDIRISIVPGGSGESIVLRLFNRNKEAMSIDSLGFTHNQVCQMRNLTRQKSGLIISSGATGSGKTTSLHAMLNTMRNSPKKIVTVEDPIEYQLEHAIQIQVNDEIGLGFQEVLRRVLRHDPDIILIGEIRDQMTAETAVQAALTGHLVLASMHSSSAKDTIARLHSLHIPSNLIASSLCAILHQWLIYDKKNRRRKGCLEILPVQTSIQSLIDSKIPLNETSNLFQKSGGCIQCN